MKKKIFFMLALLCAVAQGTWADDGWSSASSYDKYSDADKPTHYDTYGGRSDVYVIKTAANYLYVMDKPQTYCNKNIYLDINVDVSSKTWINLDDYILGVHRYLESWGSGYSGTFYGNGHTIRINLDYESYSSYKGPFGIICEGGKVQDLNVEGTIYLKKMDDGKGTDLVGGICGENNGTIENCSVSASVSSEENYLGGITGRNTGTGTISNCRVSGNVSSNSRLVGGIAGENNGTISNCWVSGNVSSDWKNSSVAATAKVGGIAGENNGTLEYCCMSGNVTNDDADVGGIVGDNSGHTISHCTFYGTRSSTHDQDNLYAGDSGTEDYCYGLYNSSEYDAASGKDLYRQAIRYTYAVNVTTVGPGTIRTWAADEYDVTRTYPNATFSLNVTSGTMARYTLTDADGNNIDLQGHANDWSSFWFVMPRKDVNVSVVFYENWPTQGAGTASDPYIISSADDWNKFAHNVTVGRSYSGSHVKLTADISVSTMAGDYTSDDDYHPFSGTFDGDGHTLTINVSNQGRFAAPFKCVKDATIKNLRTAGTIDGTGNADGKLLAGIIGVCFGNTTITGCRSSVTLTTNFGEDAAMAGIVAGTKGGSLTIEGCVFDGTMTGSTNTRCAGIAGYEYIATTTVISNTLFAPTTLTVSTADDGYTKTISRDDAPTITNCYYTEALGTAQGTEAIAVTTAPDNIGAAGTDYGMVKAYANGLYFDGMYYTAPALAGSGTEEAPYTIGSEFDWKSFVALVNNGANCSGKYVKLTADISVTTMAGASDANSFQGTFDGDGHTLTFNKSDFTEQYLAPFRYVGNATIKNLKTAGTRSTSGQYAGGLIANIVNGSTVSIEGCVSSVTISSTSYTNSGFVSRLGDNATLTIRGCAFVGSLEGSESRNNAGFVGYCQSGSTATIEDCLFAPDHISTGLANCQTFVRGDATWIINRCYYTQAYGTAQGTEATATTTTVSGTPATDYGMVKAYANGLYFDGKFYGTIASISLADNADNNTAISSANGCVANVTLSGRTLYKDGAWNTICLPFDVTIAGSPLDGATARTLTAASISGTTLNLTFGDAVTTLVAGTPYIIKWASGDNIVSPVFSGVTIDKTDRSYDNGISGDNRVRFLGTYKSTTFDAEDKSILLMGGDNTLYYPTAGAGIGAQRAYFKIGDDGALLARQLTAFRINFGDDETTGIISVHGSGSMVSGADAWYTLDGRKLSGKPTQRGIYINNGKKTIIK